MITDPIALAAALAPADRWLFLLDFDGCLSPLVDEPEDAAPAPGAVEAVRALARVTTVALVSGRDVASLRRRLPADLPALLAGGHGSELARPGEDPEPLLQVDQDVLDELVRDLEAMVDLDGGWRLERKPASIALHHRMVPDAEALLVARARRRIERAAGQDFVVLDGHDVTELRPASTDKGRVVDLLVAEHPELRPLSFGDDTTDEDAFARANHHGGRAVLVATEDRDTHATARLRGPEDVVATLTKLGASA